MTTYTQLPMDLTILPHPFPYHFFALPYKIDSKVMGNLIVEPDPLFGGGAFHASGKFSLDIKNIDKVAQLNFFCLSPHAGPLENGGRFELNLNSNELIAKSGGDVNISAGISYAVNDDGGGIFIKVSVVGFYLFRMPDGITLKFIF